MKRIFDPALLDFYLQKHEIPSLFDTPDLAFSLYQFEKGERLDTLNPEEYLSFRVDGSIEISANRADGTSYPIGYLDGFTCIGDMEFCGKRDDTHQIEARTTALCIVLPLASTKELLLNDNRFLRYLLNSVTEKLMLYSSSQSNFSTLEESFLSYLSERCPDQTFSGVEKDGHAAPLQPPPAPAGFKEAARRRTACETFERFLPPQLKTPSLPYFHDSRIDVPIVPSGIFTPKFSATDAPITAKVSFVS